MKKICIITALLASLTACTSTAEKGQAAKMLSDYQADLKNIQTDDGIDAGEAELIFRNFALACGRSTAFNTYQPIKYKDVWLSQVYLGDLISLPTITPIVLEADPKIS